VVGKRSAIMGCVAVVVLLASGAPARADQPADSSVSYQADAAHSGEVPGSTLVPALQQRWIRTDLGETSYPLVVDGLVYVVSAGSKSSYGTVLYALDALTGRTVWSRTMGGTYWYGALAYDDGHVFALNYDGLLRGLNPATGETQWAKALPGQYSFTSAPSARDGVVYTGGAGSGGTLYAVRGSDGALLWTKPVMNGDESSPAVDDKRVYVSYACSQVYAFARDTGAAAWHYSGPCEGGGGATPALSGGRLYTRDRGSSGYVFDAADGTLVDGFGAAAIPAFSGSTMVYRVGATVRAERAPVFPVWEFEGDGYLSSAPLTANGVAYVGSSSGRLYALDVASGAVLWQGTTGAAVPWPDERNVSQPLTGLGAGSGILAVSTEVGVTAFEGLGTAPPTGEPAPEPTTEPDPTVDPDPTADPTPPRTRVPAPKAGAPATGAAPAAVAPESGAAATRRAAATPRVRIASARLAGGRVVVRVRADRAGSAVLAVLADSRAVAAKGARRQLMVGRAAARLAGGRTVRVAAQLRRAARARLARTGRLRVRVLVTVRADRGEPAVAARRVTLRR
jgi:outer membrane protein assembly factor BamB